MGEGAGLIQPDQGKAMNKEWLLAIVYVVAAYVVTLDILIWRP